MARSRSASEPNIELLPEPNGRNGHDLERIAQHELFTPALRRGVKALHRHRLRCRAVRGHVPRRFTHDGHVLQKRAVHGLYLLVAVPARRVLLSEYLTGL